MEADILSIQKRIREAVELSRPTPVECSVDFGQFGQVDYSMFGQDVQLAKLPIIYPIQSTQQPSAVNELLSELGAVAWEEIEKEWKKSSPGTLLAFRIFYRLTKDS